MVLNRFSQVSILSILPAGAALLAAGTAFAANPDFRISHQAMRFNYASTTEKAKDGASGEQKTTTSNIEMFYGGFELAAFLGNWAIYSYPATTGASLVIGYTGIPNFEVGPVIGVNSSSKTVKTEGIDEEQKKSTMKFEVGAFAFYGLNLGSTKLELSLTPKLVSTSEKTEGEPATTTAGGDTEGGDSEIKTSTFHVTFDATVPFSLAENFEYAPGLDFTFSSGSTDRKDQYKTDISEIAINLNIAKFRYTF